MRSTTYISRQPESFAALLQAPSIGGLRLEPFEPVEVRDQFFDTPTGELLARGLTLRVREQHGARTAALRSLRPEADATGPADEVRLNGSATNQLVPPGPFAEALRLLVGDDPLTQALALRQSRTVRVGMDGDQAVALFSFDVVAYEVPGAPAVVNEVEVEPLGTPPEAQMQRVHEDLVGRGLVPEAASKFERGVVRVPRSLAQPVLLTPDERDALEAAARSGDPLVERRARVVLLDARGLRPDTIAAQTGLSMARVRHWRLRFREERLGILGDDEYARPEAEATPAVAPMSPVSEPAASEGTAPSAEAPSDEVVAPEAAAPAALPGGDGLVPPGDDPTQTSDMAALLDLFAPTATDTPLLVDDELDPDDAAEDDAPLDRPVSFPEAARPTRRAPVAEAPPRPTARPAGPRPAEAPRAAYPVVLGPFPVPDAPAPEPVAPAPARPMGRPVLTGETPLLDAAHASLDYLATAFDAASARLMERKAVPDVRRLLLVAHRVRLGAEAFRSVLPEAGVDRLLDDLRPLVTLLDAALDADRAAAADAEAKGYFEGLREGAIEAACGRLGSDLQRAWRDRVRLLLARLDAQRVDGPPVGGDAPQPSDDVMGDPVEVPVPTRFRHVLASMLWARYEAVRAFEIDTAAAVPASQAYRLAVAVSGLHFALGLAERASAGPVREVAELLDAEEHRILRYRNARRTADLLAEAGRPAPVVEAGTSVQEAWQALVAPAFRARLAEVAAQV